MSAPLPGPFATLVRTGAVAAAAVAPLVARLPAEERYEVATGGLRPGVALVPTRWPLRNDIALAVLAARRLPDPDGRIAGAIRELAAIADDAEAVRAFKDRSVVRLLVSGDEPSDRAANVEVVRRLVPDPPPELLAVLDEPRWPREVAQRVSAVAHVYFAAVDGLEAFHAQRKLPGMGGETAAVLIGDALRARVLTVDELIAVALGLV